MARRSLILLLTFAAITALGVTVPKDAGLDIRTYRWLFNPADTSVAWRNCLPFGTCDPGQPAFETKSSDYAANILREWWRTWNQADPIGVSTIGGGSVYPADSNILNPLGHWRYGAAPAKVIAQMYGHANAPRILIEHRYDVEKWNGNEEGTWKDGSYCPPGTLSHDPTLPGSAKIKAGEGGPQAAAYGCSWSRVPVCNPAHSGVQTAGTGYRWCQCDWNGSACVNTNTVRDCGLGAPDPAACVPKEFDPQWALYVPAAQHASELALYSLGALSHRNAQYFATYCDGVDKLITWRNSFTTPHVRESEMADGTGWTCDYSTGGGWSAANQPPRSLGYQLRDLTGQGKRNLANMMPVYYGNQEVRFDWPGFSATSLEATGGTHTITAYTANNGQGKAQITCCSDGSPGWTINEFAGGRAFVYRGGATPQQGWDQATIESNTATTLVFATTAPFTTTTPAVGMVLGIDRAATVAVRPLGQWVFTLTGIGVDLRIDAARRWKAAEMIQRLYQLLGPTHLDYPVAIEESLKPGWWGYYDGTMYGMPRDDGAMPRCYSPAIPMPNAPSWPGQALVSPVTTPPHCVSAGGPMNVTPYGPGEFEAAYCASLETLLDAVDASPFTDVLVGVTDAPPYLYSTQLACSARRHVRWMGNRAAVSVPSEQAPVQPAVLVPSFQASISSGVAPLFVFFDATATTSTTAGDDELMDLHYSWSFGDATAGTWTQSGRSKNAAQGFAAAHVFETPSATPYTVTLTVRDGLGNTASTTRTITVQDPTTVFAGQNTICFSTSGTFTGCPGGATPAPATSDFATVLASAAPGKRLLLRRGEQWTASSTGLLSGNGPGLIGAFGTGNKPRINVSTDVKAISAAATSELVDWRIVDLNFVGSGTGDGTFAVKAERTLRNFLMLRADASGFFNALLAEESALAYYGAPMNDGVAVVDGTFAGTYQNTLYVAANRLALLGNLIYGNTGNAHSVRSVYSVPGVIQHNRFERTTPGTSLLKLHGPPWAGGTGFQPGVYNEKVILSDNRLQDGAVDISPQNDFRDERLRRILVERNFITDTNTGEWNRVVLQGDKMVARNNVARLTQETTPLIFSKYRALGQPSTDARAYQNTCYSKKAGAVVSCVQFDATNTGHVARNNVLYGPTVHSSSVAVSNLAAGGTISDNRNPAQLTGTPFISADPVAATDHRLKVGSQLIDAGTSVPVLDDYDLDLRSGVRDIGAFEYP